MYLYCQVSILVLFKHLHIQEQDALRNLSKDLVKNILESLSPVYDIPPPSLTTVQP